MMSTETLEDLEQVWREKLGQMRVGTPSPTDHVEERRLWDQIMWGKYAVGECMVISCRADRLPDDEWRRCADHPEDYT